MTRCRGPTIQTRLFRWRVMRSRILEESDSSDKESGGFFLFFLYHESLKGDYKRDKYCISY